MDTKPCLPTLGDLVGTATDPQTYDRAVLMRDFLPLLAEYITTHWNDPVALNWFNRALDALSAAGIPGDPPPTR